MADFLPFALPEIGEEEIDEVVNTLRSGWLTTGPKAQQFESDFVQFIGDNAHAIAVNSATAGLHLVLEAIGISPGDEIITTPYTFTATAEVIRYLGAHPVFVDIDPLTMNIDTDQIEKAITSRTKAILPVHFGGLSCEMEPIFNLARRYGLKVVEDAAHALPATYQGRLVGSLESDAVVYSFYATKTITTGEGGMIVTRNPDIAQRCRIMRLHGISRDAFQRYTSSRPAWYYEVVAPGFKYNMMDMAAAVGIQQLKKVWKFQQRREEMAKHYADAFEELPLVLPSPPKTGDLHAWHLYVIRLGDSVKVTREEFIEKMFAAGIGCSVHFIPLHIHPYWRETYHLKPEDYPVSLDSYSRAVSLPLYTKMTDTDQERVIETVKEILGC